MEGLARFDQAGSRGEQRKLTESTNPISGRQGGSRRGDSDTDRFGIFGVRTNLSARPATAPNSVSK
jgi:hypothetical protein